ncbi:transporter [Polynucleobacter sp. AP-Sving-400A-A2]|uniref:transporter n=1 Tax=Polynucleobacter sp. AP-Sving-400A-A2 TaxID=2081049 RepID=UPI001BFE8F2F|nr:transporter [Polynucleobacter sp. AP-Sving-400A-A2]QWE13670.1 transporter [Polynucleobacter sp. AP-Sving-400A-A2]
MIKLHSISQGRTFVIGVWLLLITGALLPDLSYAQEIEARTYSNAPVGINFISAGVAQAKAGNYTLTSEVMGLTHIFDAGGQSGKITLVLPYGQLTGSSTIGGRTVNASTEGLSDPLIKAAVNLYGAPALTLDQFKSYQQDLIIGVSLAASVPWGKYNDNQLINVGANRWFIQPGLGVSKALGSWRFELAGAGIFYTSNTDYMGGNSLSQNPVYSTQTHGIYYFQNTAWISVDATYFIGGQSYLNGNPISGSQENWRFGTTMSYPVNKHNSIRLSASTGAYSRTNNSYDLYGISWQYRFGGGL